MDNFKIIYKILRILEEAMDYEVFDNSLLIPELFGVSENRFYAIMRMLQEEGYISGVIFSNSRYMTGIKLSGPRITLKGLEYLEENTTMKKVAGLLRGIKETIPGL